MASLRAECDRFIGMKVLSQNHMRKQQEIYCIKISSQHFDLNIYDII